MRVFLSEYLTSGAVTAEFGEKASLAVEGKAMLRALAADAVALHGLEVAVTWDGDLEPFDIAGVEVHQIHSPAEELHVFDQLSATADVTLVIAPEFDGILEGRCQRVDRSGGMLTGSSPEAIALCGDKLALSRHLERRGVPIIETWTCDFQALAEAIDEQRVADGFVVKPRDGAGSVSTFHVRSHEELVKAEATFRSNGTAVAPIAQRFIAGVPLSIAAIVSERGIELLPICRQRISTCGRLHYQGGTVPADLRDVEDATDVARQALCCIPGLRGYVGLDLILPASAPQQGEPVVVEINPRLTSSYLGYRRLSRENLASRVLWPDRPSPSVSWRRGQVEFQPDGVASHLPL